MAIEQGAIVGSIPAWGLFRVLRALQDRPGDTHLVLGLQGGRSGASTDATVSIGLQQGRPRCVSTEFSPLSLATHLAHSRTLPETALEYYQARSRAEAVPLCRVLTSERALPPEELARQVEAHTRAVVEALLPRAIPAWSSRPHDPCGGTCGTTGFDPVPLLMRTVARHPDIETMRAIVSRFVQGADFHLAPGYEAFLTAARGQFHDARILFLLRQGRHQEMARAADSDERDLRVLFALIVAGAVERGASRSAVVERKDPSEDPVSQELHHTALDFRSRNHYEVLGLSVECRVSEVEEASRRLRRRFARTRYEATATPRALQYLDEINTRVDEAVRTLTDLDLRSAYNRTLDTLTADVQARLTVVFEARRSWQSGMVALKAGDHKEAVARFEQAVRQDPEEPLYPLALARAVVAVSASPAGASRARGLAEGVLAKWPEFPEAHVVMAHILRGEGRKDEAMTHVRAVLRQDPEHAEARRLKELLSAQSAPVAFRFQKKPESVLTRLKRKLTSGDS